MTDPITSGEFDYSDLGLPYSAYDWAISGVNCMIYLSSKANKVRRMIDNIPIIGVNWEINQAKTPIYGYQDVGPKTMAVGSRLVSGAILTPHYEVGQLEKLLKKATRDIYGTQAGPGGVPANTLDINENLRLKYWNTRYWGGEFPGDSSTADVDLDPQRKNFDVSEQRHLFYRHPNFDISIVYGLGDEVNITTGTPGTSVNISEILDKYSQYSGPNATRNYMDVNPLYRPPESNSFVTIDRKKQRETIVGVQITGLAKQVSADDGIILNTYTFVAYDVVPK